MKKITTLFMLMIGLSGITTQATDADLYALVYPSSTGPLSNLYNSNATAQDEIDKFLNNQPSLLDAFNGGTADSPGLGTRKLYLYYNTGGDIPAMVNTDEYAYIYYDSSAGCTKIHYNGFDPGAHTWPTGELQYKKVLVDSATASGQGWIEMPLIAYYYVSTSLTQPTSSRAYIKIKTSDENADQGGVCYFSDASLQLGSINITGYKMLTTDDCFLPVYQPSTTTTTEA
jgi:hypothetical protein